MSKGGDERRHAQEALRQASVTKHDVDQTIWLRLAQTWFNLLPNDRSRQPEPLMSRSLEDTDQEKSESSYGTVLRFRRH
jgi:hypothetical protein